MIAKLAAFAFIAATLPAPPAGAEGDVLIAKLCNGGTIEIPIGDSEDQEPKGPCHLQACHAGTCRVKVKHAV